MTLEPNNQAISHVPEDSCFLSASVPYSPVSTSFAFTESAGWYYTMPYSLYKVTPDDIYYGTGHQKPCCSLCEQLNFQHRKLSFIFSVPSITSIDEPCILFIPPIPPLIFILLLITFITSILIPRRPIPLIQSVADDFLTTFWTDML